MTATKHEHTYTRKERIFRISVVAVLSVLGYLLLLLGQFDFMKTPLYIFWEISDLVVLIAMALYGPVSAIIVTTIKMLLFFLTRFDGVFYPIDSSIYALFASSLILITISFSLNYIVRFFKRQTFVKIIGDFICIVLTSLIMTALSYLYFTPMHFHNDQFIDISQINTSAILANNPEIFPVPSRGFLTYMFIYHLPYYSIKYTIVFILFELISFYIINPYLKSEYFGVHRYFFTNKNDFRIPYHILSFRKFSNDYFKKKELSSRHRKWIKKSNTKKTINLEEQTEEINDFIIRENYLYRITITDSGMVHTDEIKANKEGALLIMNYMKNSYPNIRYKVTSYQEDNSLIRDASSDGLSFELFRQVNHCDKEITKVLNVEIVLIKKSTKKVA